MPASLQQLDEATRALVQLGAVIAIGDEGAMRQAFARAAEVTPAAHVEELVLQSYLFCGFPRALNAAREWRRLSPRVAGVSDGADGTGSSDAEEWRHRGEDTCAQVYGRMYEKLRHNVHELHPALDAWMITDGYGKVLSRPALDLPRRELCIVAACAAMGQDRQLHSHLHGAINVGVLPGVVEDVIDAIAIHIGEERARSARLLLARVVGK